MARKLVKLPGSPLWVPRQFDQNSRQSKRRKLASAVAGWSETPGADPGKLESAACSMGLAPDTGRPPTQRATQ